jgi:methylenetetrahydrofolate dehydrogenase (NADP+)/methenyltetrahydrofolate cyclohydrolase
VLVYVAPEETAATRSYLKIKARSAEEAGCDFDETRSMTFSARADAVIVQLPLSSEMNTTEVLNAIPISQDADVLSNAAREKFERGDTDALLPPVVGALAKILNTEHIELKGKQTVVVGSGFLVGAPSAMWLAQQGALVTVVNRTTANFQEVFRDADIIVLGAGTPHFIKPEMLKRGVVLIDAGTSESNGAIAGDADPTCADVCSIFTPVPGGLGPIAVACLFENVVLLAEKAIHI